MAMSNPTKAEKLYWDRLAEIGCIACLHDGKHNTHVSIHHCAGRTKNGSHMFVLPLCAEHHQTGGEDAPAIHPWKTRFQARYGTQAQLSAECNHILKARGYFYE
jgi:hypothetical protein